MRESRTLEAARTSARPSTLVEDWRDRLMYFPLVDRFNNPQRRRR
jgi:hypothetical protein